MITAAPVRRDVVERVLAHKHCPECGLSISTKERYCSDDCRTTNEARIRAKKRQLLWLYFGSIGLFGLAMLLLFGGFG